MKPDNDLFQLERLTASEDPELASALAVMRQHVPDASQLAALAAQLVAQGLPITSGTPAAPPALSGAARTLKLSLITGAALVGIGGAVLLLRRPSIEHQPPRPVVAAPADLREPIGGTRSAPDLAERAARGVSNPMTTSAAGIASSSELPDAAREPFLEPANSAAPRAAVPRAPSSPTDTSTARSAPAPAAGAAKAARSGVSPAGSGPEPSAAARPSELVLLRDARLALRSSPSQALALTEQHGRLYPRGAMAQERELIAISALSSLGRHSAALLRASEFERSFPNSPYRKQVTQLAR